MMTNRLVLVLVAASAVAAPVAAQQRSQLDDASSGTLMAVAQGGPATALVQETTARRAEGGGGAGRTVLQTLGGAILGAGAGYLASQVAWSDWDKHSNSEFAGRRLSFTLGGTAVGALAGLVLGHGSGPRSENPGSLYAPERRSNAMGRKLTSDDLRASTATNLYELLQALRPNWLYGRGVGSVRAGRPIRSPMGGGNSAPSDGTEASALPAQGEGDQASASVSPRVYLDGAVIGDINKLREMLVSETESVEYLDAAAATYRFGAGNQSGVILVTTLGRGSDMND